MIAVLPNVKILRVTVLTTFGIFFVSQDVASQTFSQDEQTGKEAQIDRVSPVDSAPPTESNANNWKKKQIRLLRYQLRIKKNLAARDYLGQALVSWTPDDKRGLHDILAFAKLAGDADRYLAEHRPNVPGVFQVDVEPLFDRSYMVFPKRGFGSFDRPDSMPKEHQADAWRRLNQMVESFARARPFIEFVMEFETNATNRDALFTRISLLSTRSRSDVAEKLFQLGLKDVVIAHSLSEMAPRDDYVQHLVPQLRRLVKSPSDDAAIDAIRLLSRAALPANVIAELAPRDEQVGRTAVQTVGYQVRGHIRVLQSAQGYLGDETMRSECGRMLAELGVTSPLRTKVNYLWTARSVNKAVVAGQPTKDSRQHLLATQQSAATGLKVLTNAVANHSCLHVQGEAAKQLEKTGIATPAVVNALAQGLRVKEAAPACARALASFEESDLAIRVLYESRYSTNVMVKQTCEYALRKLSPERLRAALDRTSSVLSNHAPSNQQSERQRVSTAQQTSTSEFAPPSDTSGNRFPHPSEEDRVERLKRLLFYAMLMQSNMTAEDEVAQLTLQLLHERKDVRLKTIRKLTHLARWAGAADAELQTRYPDQRGLFELPVSEVAARTHGVYGADGSDVISLWPRQARTPEERVAAKKRVDEVVESFARAIPFLEYLMIYHEDEVTRVQVAALYNRLGPRATPFLLDKLQQPNLTEWEYRLVVKVLIPFVDDPAVIRALHKALDSDDESTREIAEKALRDVGPDRVQAALNQAASSNEQTASQSTDVQIAD